jgi:oxygen-independent coproporphyrinogen III oxidase
VHAEKLLDNGPGVALSCLYVHVPFCRERCTYCAFTTVADDPGLHAVLVDALLHEGHAHDRDGAFDGGAMHTVYLGGGTPGLLDADALARLISGLRSLAPWAPQAELTLEANPANVTPRSLEAWAALGVNRLSLGIQTFHDDVLHALGRRHDAAMAHHALDLVRRHWPHTWSADLLVGWVGQRRDDLDRDLHELLAHEPPHVSVYGLTIEPATPLERLALRGVNVTAPPSRLPAFDSAWSAALSDAGLERYEVSNFARPGHRSRHNQAYWSNASYLGLGPGASSSLHPWRWVNRADLSGYLHAAATGHGVRSAAERVSPLARLLETLSCGLRTSDGLRLPDLDQRFSPAWRPLLEPSLRPLVASGWMRELPGRLVATDAARVRLDAILRELVADLDHPRAVAGSVVP